MKHSCLSPRLILRLFVMSVFCEVSTGPCGLVRASSDPGPAVKAAAPNVVLIISDDQAWTDYSFMGHPTIKTPRLDQLASRSAVFRRGYTPMGLCRPSLMTMITGLYPHQHGVVGNDPYRAKSVTDERYSELRSRLIEKIDHVSTLPELLGESGYRSHQSGKWWEGNYRRGGFTEGMTRGFPERGGRHGDDGLAIGREGMKPVFDFVDKSVSEGKPFLLWYAPFLPHTPHTPPQRLLSKYTARDRPIELAKYYAMCEWFDETCGQLTDYLDQKKLTDNTLIVYMTDNGWIQATPDMNLGPGWGSGFAPKSKQSVYEGGVRTPILYSWPGQIKPGERLELASTIDVFPTVLAAAGLPVPNNLPGLNLLPTLKGEQKLDRDFLYGETYSHDVADVEQPTASLICRWCIEKNWKLIVTYEHSDGRNDWVHSLYEKKPQLFDLTNDPHEVKNLAAEHPDLVERLADRLQDTWKIDNQPIGVASK